MKDCPWERIDGFQSPGEVKRFLNWISEQVATGQAREVPVESPYLGQNTMEEKWFVHLDSGQVWRLILPDPPSKGTFEPVV